jgi:ABC-2 type transport system permease protein
MYMVIMLGMYDPETIDAMNLYVEALPQGMMEAFGYDIPVTNLITFMAVYFYGFLVLMFPLIYCIILANRLVAVLVDRGSMTFLLANLTQNYGRLLPMRKFLIS